MFIDSGNHFTDAWVRFLRRYTWSLYAHLTFRDTPSQRRADDAFRTFIHKLNRQLYGQSYWKHHSGVRWVRAEELQEREVVHFHVLIGHGPVTAPFERRLTAEFAQHTWRRLAGDGLVETYHAFKHGIAYLVKKYSPEYGRIEISSNMEAAPL